MNAHTKLHLVLDAVERRDKTAVVEALDAVEHALGRGFHPARFHVRAAACGADIGNWDVVRLQTHAALNAA